MSNSRSGKTVRLTVAQAVVTYLSRQYSVADGERRRLIPATLGIFGHGNVAGLGQALDLARVVTDEQCGHLPLGQDTLQIRENALLQAHIERGQGFVHQQHFRATQERSPQSHALTLPAAK